MQRIRTKLYTRESIDEEIDDDKMCSCKKCDNKMCPLLLDDTFQYITRSISVEIPHPLKIIKSTIVWYIIHAILHQQPESEKLYDTPL